MPILKVDQFGQIYSSDPDREDGDGYGYAPECVEQQDLTLGAAYLKDQSRRRDALIKLTRDNQLIDKEDSMIQAKKYRDYWVKKQRDMAEFRMLQNPKMKNAITKKALGAGCDCEYRTPMSGNVMSANGQFGVRGMTPDQQTIHNVAKGSSMGVYPIDRAEANQHQARAQAEKLLRVKARR